jgi:hypothetical protein
MSEAHAIGQYPFPGRWLGGACLVAGPLLMLTGALLRLQFHFFAPQQLEAFAAYPALITAAYSTYWCGAVTLCFGMLLLVHQIAAWNRTWAFWGGALAVIGLFNRIFSAGVDHLAFQMVTVLGAEQAWAVVDQTYRVLHVFRFTNGAVMLGWPVLAIAAYRAGILGPLRSAALATMLMLPMGTLKGTEIRSIALVGLCVALIPLGLRVLREGPPLSRRARFWIAVFALWNVAWLGAAWMFPAVLEH